MDDNRIFFKDKQGEMKGPFTERQVQEWYRRRWYEGESPFYFSEALQPADVDQTTHFTLNNLREINGVGCPFFKVCHKAIASLKKAREERGEKLSHMEKEIAATNTSCESTLQLQQRVEEAERMLQELAKIVEQNAQCDVEKKEEENSEESGEEKENAKEGEKKKDKKKKKKTAAINGFAPLKSPVKHSISNRVGSVHYTSEQLWDMFESHAACVAELVADALKPCASADSSDVYPLQPQNIENLENLTAELFRGAAKGLEREAKSIIEYRIVERLQKEDWFCCALCRDACFNYQQALIHFCSQEHISKETEAECKSGLPRVRAILEMVTLLPKIWAEADRKAEMARRRKYGAVRGTCTDWLRPEGDFAYEFITRYAKILFTDTVVARDPLLGHERFCLSTTDLESETRSAVHKTKGEMGRRAFAELHAHLGNAQTYCVYCQYKTGDREGFYAHLCSIQHLKQRAKDVSRFDLFTVIVNLHRRDLILP